MIHVHKAGFLAAILLANSCSIKEDRSQCPCRLEVLMKDCKPMVKELTLSAWNAGQVFVKAVPVNEGTDSLYYMVPRGTVVLTAVSGVRIEELSEGSMILPKGSSCDSLWTYTAEVDCRGETALAEVSLRQQFATVHLSVERKGTDGDYPYQLVLKSGVNGLSFPYCEPNEGLWSRPLVVGDDGIYLFRVPRQKDGSLSLDLFLDGEKVESYPVGEHIVRAGYDWTKDRLEDIYIGMDWGQTEAHIHIEAWEDGGAYDAVL